MASTATFTSCKDYDDDIDSINNQIKDINSKISSLESKVNTTPGVYVSKVESVAGGLKVTLSDGSSYNLTLPTAPAGDKVEIADNGEWTINGEKTGWYAAPFEVDPDPETPDTPADVKVPYVKDGYWYFNDEKSDIKASGAAYVVIADGIATLNIPDENGVMKQVVLPAAANAITGLELNGANPLTTGKNYAWNLAAADVEFNGKSYKAGDLLTAPLPSISFTVTPMSYDLSAQVITLVDVDQKNAPVVVTATPAADNGTDERAASADGKWTLSLAYDATITAENIATAFTKTVNGIEKNLKYAIAVNGTRVTGYDYVIDTQTSNESKNNADLTKDEIALADKVAKIGETTMSLADVSKVVDAYMKFTGNDAAKAEVAGVKINGMTVTAPATAAGTSYGVEIYVLDVNGNVVKTTSNISIASTQIVSTDKTAEASVQIGVGSTISVDLGEIFKNLDANTVAAANNYYVTVDNKKFFALASRTEDTAGGYKVSTAVAFKDADGENAASALRTAVKAVITLGKYGTAFSNYLTGATKLSELYGKFNLTMAIRDSQNNELKRVIIPVKVEKPSWDYFFSNNEYANWVDGNLNTAVISATSGGNAAFKLDNSKLFVVKKYNNIAAVSPAIADTLSYSYKLNTTTSYKLVDLLVDSNNEFDLVANFASAPKAYKNSEKNPDAAYTDMEKHILSTIQNASGVDTNLKNLDVTSFNVSSKQEVAKVEFAGVALAQSIFAEKTYQVNFAPSFASAPKLVYIENDEVKEVAQVNSSDNITLWDQTEVASDGSKTYHNGLALVGADEKPMAISVSVAYGAFTIKPNTSVRTSALTTLTALSGATNIDMYFDKAENSMGTIGTITLATPSSTLGSGSIVFNGLNVGEGGELVVTFADRFGLTKTASIKYKK